MTSPLDWCATCHRGVYCEGWCSFCGATPFEGGPEVHALCGRGFHDIPSFLAHIDEGRCVALQALARSGKLPPGADYQVYRDEAVKAQVRGVGRPNKSLRARRETKARYQRALRARRRGDSRSKSA